MADFNFAVQAQQQALIMQQMQLQQMRLRMSQNGSAGQSGGTEIQGTQGNLPNQAGTLYVNDTFTPWGAEVPHGTYVVGAARQQGFRGHIVGTNRSASGPGPVDRQAMAHETDLQTPGRSTRQTIADLRAWAGTNAASLLEQESNHLDRLTRSGAHNSAVNMSQGQSKASNVEQLYLKLMPALRLNRNENDPRFAGANAMLENIASAAGLDMQKLRSSDEKVRNAERGRMTQFLINQVSAGMDSNPTLAASRQRWNTSVRNFEARHNSVVISAGNEGRSLSDLMEAHGGYRLSAPSDFSRNVLQNNAVTSVGSTRQGSTTGNVNRAEYTSNSNGIDVYANGGTGYYQGNGQEVDGTSFAAPRVAAMMAELHRRNPNMSSAQVENLVQQQLSRNTTDRGTRMFVLDDQRTSSFLAGRTF